MEDGGGVGVGAREDAWKGQRISDEVRQWVIVPFPLKLSFFTPVMVVLSKAPLFVSTAWPAMHARQPYY